MFTDCSRELRLLKKEEGRKKKLDRTVVAGPLPLDEGHTTDACDARPGPVATLPDRFRFEFRCAPQQREGVVIPPRASGWWTGLLMQERADAAVPRRALEAKSRSKLDEARDWARRAGFENVERAAVAAVMLRMSHGAGNVTRAMVRARLAAREGEA